MDSKINGGKLEPANVFRRDAVSRTAGVITQSNGGYVIADTATTAKVGDIYRPETATTAEMVRKEYKVIDVAADGNSFTIASKDIPTLGDTFFILAEVTPLLSEDGIPEVSVNTAGLATEAKQDDQIVILGDIQDAVDSIDLKTPVVGQAVMASSSPVVIASNQTSIPVAATLSDETSKVIGTVRIDQSTPGTTNGVQVNAPLPAGTNNIGEIDVVSLPSIPAGTNNIGDVDVLTLPPIPAGTNNIGDVDVLSLPSIPTGANVIGFVAIDQTTPGTTNLVALAENQSVNVAQMNGVATAMGNGTSNTGTQRVVIASDNTSNTNPFLIKQGGKSVSNRARNDYTSVNVTTAAYVQLLAATSSAITEVEIFDSSGQTLILATGAAASEVDQLYVFPGGNGRVPLAIATATRVSIKAVSATASVGEITINFYN
jgi:hypothetical protein